MNRVAKFSKVSFDQFYNDYCGTFLMIAISRLKNL